MQRKLPRSSSSDDTALHIGDAADLVVAVPYLLGFRPAESLVLVALERNRVIVSARVDLADLLDGSATAQPLDEAVSAAARSGADSAVALVFSDEAVRIDDMPHRRVVDAVGFRAAAAGLLLLDVLVVRRGRWWSFVCIDGGCAQCSDDGQAVDEYASPVAAAATFRGLVALPSREAVADLLRPAEDRDRLEPLIAAHENGVVQAVVEGQARRQERAATRALFAAAREADRAEPDLSDERIARFGVALTVTAVRDGVWLAIDAGRLEGHDFWRHLARRLPPPYDAAPLFLTGWSAWRNGDGVLAGIAAERALESDPTYHAADMLLAALAHGVNPYRMPRLRRSRSA